LFVAITCYTNNGNWSIFYNEFSEPLKEKQSMDKKQNDKKVHIIFGVLAFLAFLITNSWTFSGKIVVFALLALAYYFSYQKSKKKQENIAPVGKADKSDGYNSVIFENFSALGTTVQEREKAINCLFDEKKQSIHFQWHWKHSEEYRNDENHLKTDYSCYKTIALNRNLASMEAKERAFLKIAFHLLNEGKIEAIDYRNYLLAFVHGGGKAVITTHKAYTHKQYSGIKDPASLVQYVVDNWKATVDSAINSILTRISALEYDNTISSSLKKAIKDIHGGGSGSWLTEEEIGNSIFKNQNEYSLSLGVSEESGKTVYYSGEGSLISIAPPGAGKTQCFVIPNMANWRGAALVLDIKGEIYNATHEWRAKNMGNVFMFNPLDPKNSHCYNPLDFVRDNPEFIWEDSLLLAEMLFVPSTNSKDPYFDGMALEVITAAIAHVTFNNEAGSRSMSLVLDIIYDIGWDEMITAMKNNIVVSSMRRSGYNLEKTAPQQKDSILKTAQTSLRVWQGERMVKITSKSDWHPMDLRKGAPTIYICIEAHAIESYLSVIRVFIAQHLRTLTTELPKKDAAPILFMLDELPRLKNMPPVDEALNIGRQYGIKLWMFAQNYGQLKEVYPNAEGLLSSCTIRTYMNLQLNDEFTTKLSDQLGYRHDALNNSKEKLVEPATLAGPDYRDLILVFGTGTKPLKLKKKFAYQDDTLKHKIKF
jgi:type IV secretion system protein VirD4